MGQTCLVTYSFGQDVKVNLIIQLNDGIVDGNISNIRIAIETDKEKFNLELDYVPGDLILSEQVYKILKFDSVKSSTLMFDLHNYERDEPYSLNVKTPFYKFQMERPYAILNVYDLRDKKFKRQLGYLTKDEYICEYVIPNGGRLIRNR